MVLPARLRRRLGFRPGDDLVVSEEPGGVLRVESRDSAARALIGLAGPLPGASMVDELRADRRREAAAEDADGGRPSR